MIQYSIYSLRMQSYSNSKTHFKKKRIYTKAKQSLEQSIVHSLSKEKSNHQLRNPTHTDFLVIVESPSKCAKIESYLGPQYKCIASKGHIREIGGLKNIDVKHNFAPSFTIMADKAAHVEQMRAILSHYKSQQKTNIFLATDDDREGEAIAWHLCQVFDLPVETTPRLLFREITKPAILDAIQNPSRINMNMVYAQHARQVLDILVGFKISPVLWKQIHNEKKNALSAGRCQTPALRLVYDNEMERKRSTPEMRYKTIGRFFSQSIAFDLNREFETVETAEAFLEETKQHAHTLTIHPAKPTTKRAPQPLNTSRLLQIASNVLRSSPKQTMQTCQTLYQNGWITYMRTENTKYSAQFLDIIRAHLEKTYGTSYIGPLDALVNKDDTNPHEAIRATDIHLRELPDTCKAHEVSMYALIWRMTMESCMPDATYNTTTVSISAPGQGDVLYNHILEIPVFMGWKKVACEQRAEGPREDEPETRLLFFQTLSEATKQNVPYTYIESTVVMRNKLSHYTEASLVQALEERGIGRPSTFATIVDTIQERGYVHCTDIPGKIHKCIDFKLRRSGSTGILDKNVQERAFGNEKSKLAIQPMGILCIEFLIHHFDTLFSYSYTKTMEDDLDKITNFAGEAKHNPWYDLCSTCNEDIEELTKVALAKPKETYPLDECHELVFQSFGPSIRQRDATTGQLRYRAVKPNMMIDLDKLRAKQYTLQDLLALDNEYLGEYEGGGLYIKVGKFGAYAEWNGQRRTLRGLDVPLDQLDYATVVDYLSKEDTKTEDSADLGVEDGSSTHTSAVRRPPPPPNKAVLRTLTTELSIRKGKYGPYIYYKTASMGAPQFFPLKKCPLDYKTSVLEPLVEWINTTYLASKT